MPRCLPTRPPISFHPLFPRFAPLFDIAPLTSRNQRIPPENGVGITQLTPAYPPLIPRLLSGCQKPDGRSVGAGTLPGTAADQHLAGSLFQVDEGLQQPGFFRLKDRFAHAVFPLALQVRQPTAGSALQPGKAGPISSIQGEQRGCHLATPGDPLRAPCWP